MEPKENPYKSEDLIQHENIVQKGNPYSGRPAIEPKSIFEKRNDGITRKELAKELEKIPNDFSIKMNKQERKEVPDHMDKKKYGERIDQKDVDKYIKVLKKEASLGKTLQERQEAVHEINLLKKAKESEM